MSSIRFVILGQPVSKANSRQIALVGPKGAQRVLIRKSDAGLAYEADVLRQIPPSARQRLEGPVRFTATLFYANELSDLDETLLLDCLQDRWTRNGMGVAGTVARQLVQAGVYRNDRQVRERHVFHAIDKANPRAEVLIEPLQAQATALPGFEVIVDQAQPKNRITARTKRSRVDLELDEDRPF